MYRLIFIALDSIADFVPGSVQLQSNLVKAGRHGGDHAHRLFLGIIIAAICVERTEKAKSQKALAHGGALTAKIQKFVFADMIRNHIRNGSNIQIRLYISAAKQDTILFLDTIGADKTR